MFPLKSRFGDLPEERARFVPQDLRGVEFSQKTRGIGKDRVPIDGTGLQADFRLEANRSMEGKEQGRDRPGKEAIFPRVKMAVP